MRWRAPSERVQGWLIAPFAVPVVAVAAVVILPVVPVLMLMSWADRKLRPSEDWHRWFAWRPVRLGHWSDHVGKRGGWAWLETVERRARPYNWPTEYRPSVPAGTQGEVE